MAPLFDVVVAVDWSASSVPTTGADSIWIAAAALSRRTAVELVNPPTRHAAIEHLSDLLASHAGERVLVGIDVPLGYPSGTAAALGLRGVPWRATWRLLRDRVADDETNRNDRFEVAGELNARLVGSSRSTPPSGGPFWGRPATRPVPGVATTKSPPVEGRPSEWRRCEAHLRRLGRRPSSVWQLAYAGSVGGQVLTALPALARLAERHARIVVWPFETGLRLDGSLAADAVVLAEVWPSWFDVDRGRHEVKDAAQVLHVVDELLAADASGALGEWAAPALEPAEVAAVTQEEGWLLAPLG
jgi:precorrin-8X/cobalt-precorrin-8 methylmutase